jgi:uncharacterized repeat protein (TIGR01451 family)/fimbrial isopeptide formation D2 family protein
VIIATITILNANTRPILYNDNIVVTLPADLSYIPGTTVRISGPDGNVLAEPDIYVSSLTWGRTQASPQNIDISSGAANQLKFQISLRVNETIQPGKPLGVTVRSDWTSLDVPGTPGSPGPDLGVPMGAPGAANGERNGSGTSPDTYFKLNSATVTVGNVYSVSKSSSASTSALADGSFRIGDLIRYTISAAFQEGTVNNASIQDTLPAGLAYSSLISVAPASAHGGQFEYSGPSVGGSTGTLTFNFGTVVSTGNNITGTDNVLTLVYEARVKDSGISNPLAAPSNPLGVSSQTLVNAALMRYTDYNNTPRTTPLSGSTVTVKQPLLTIGKTLHAGQAYVVGESSAVAYTITVTNAGTGPAYDIQVKDILPLGMRIFTPVMSSATLNGVSAAVTLNYTQATGAVVWTLGDTQILDGTVGGSSRTLVIDYVAQTDAGIGGGLSFTNGARVEQYFSKPSDDPTDRRTYAPTVFSSATVITSSPTAIAKFVSVSTATIGETVVYTILVPTAPVNFAIYNLRVLDTLPAGLTIAGVANNRASLAMGSCDSAVVDDATSGNILDVKYHCLPPNTQAVITATGTVKDVGGNVQGAVLTNISSFTWAQTSGGPAHGPVIQSSSVTITLREPALSVGKILHAGQVSVVGEDDAVAYTITVINTGLNPAYDIQVKDILPPRMRNTAPVMSSATINGVSVGLTLEYTKGTGVALWNLSDAQFIPGAVPGSTQTLVIDYVVHTDTGIGGGLAFSNLAQVTEYYSKPASDPDGRRTYGVTNTSATTVTTPLPSIAKSVNISTATIGETVIYTIRVPASPIDVAVYNLNVLDSLPAGLTVAGVSNNGASLALSPGSCDSVAVDDHLNAGNTVNLTYNCLPPGTQAVIIATGTVTDSAANQEGILLANISSFTWAQTAGGPTQTEIHSSSVTTTVREPLLTIEKTKGPDFMYDSGQGLQQGDTVQYHIKVTNVSGTNRSAAYDLVIRDVSDANLTLTTVLPGSLDPGQTSTTTAAGLNTYSWSVPGPLAPGGTYEFDLQFTLGVGVQPQQQLVNRSSVTWTSLAGVVSGERTGIGGVDDYVAVSQTAVTVTAGSAHVEKALLGRLKYAVGELVNYQIDFTFGRGTVDGVHLFDVLPTGLIFSSAAVVTSNVQQAGGGTVVLVSSPSAGAVGSLDFELDDLQSTQPEPLVSLYVTARVKDLRPDNVNGHTLTNAVSAQVTASTGGPVSVSPVKPMPTVTVIEPLLTLGKTLRPGQAYVVGASTTVAYRITIPNTGTSPAYNIQVKDTLPAGMRLAAPVMSSATLNGVSVGLTLNYTPATGVIQWNLSDAQALSGVTAGSTQTLVIDYNAQTDANLGGGLTLTNGAYVTEYYSKPLADPGPAPEV